MAVRIRKDGTILCAAMHPEQPGDTYLHDGIHYILSIELHALVTDRYHLRKDPDTYERDPGSYTSVLDGHGKWWWANDVPEGVEIDKWWERRANAVPS